MPASRTLVRSLICSAEWFMSLIYRRPWWPQAPTPSSPDERYDGVAVPFQIEGDAVFVATNEELSEQGRLAIHGEARAFNGGDSHVPSNSKPNPSPSAGGCGQSDVGPTSARASSIGFDENAGAARADVKSGPFSLTG